MSASSLARRVEICLEFEGVDISTDISQHLIAMTYTDNEEDKTDDLQLTLDDRDGVWLDWLNIPAQPPLPPATSSGWKIGDVVTANGRPQYSSYGNGNPGAMLNNYKGKVTYLNLKSGIPYPIHVDQKGWFAESQVKKEEAKQDTMMQSGGAKGAMLHALIVQKNWDFTGKDKMLNCGIFEVDSVDVSGPPEVVNIKGTSLPYTSTIRIEKKTKAWENIYLSAIAEEIAVKNGMKSMFESTYNPYYSRREQVQQSDIVFLRGLCKGAGISLKVTSKTIVLFDAATYEQKNAVRTIQRGSADIKSYRFGTNSNDTAYSSCKVSYTNPQTGKTIEYTYKPQNPDGTGQQLEINEKVNNREEARQLAMKRLREKNKREFTAELNLVGDLDLIAGVTVEVVGYGAFDGKYMVESATHNLAGGYTVKLKLRRVLEGY
ncbi:phage protein D [Hydrogenoanaerobacterium saccharovorans]|uniref:Phage protein D n=1 Tax=Hydrogenoanaerobacterium saccharovorans TaxID=474960 RepID=A0A1H7ZZB9_9FIRM|nr:hypothetical protein [Hydrogenoanaerobacterium saccharovorans]RPF48264.1 phage protein D [Hydrogenoanaerobacterium saccharovorans]SEM63815.1 Phage protein D [Hydrogenoanaerobacterium saccharovorans]